MHPVPPQTVIIRGAWGPVALTARPAGAQLSSTGQGGLSLRARFSFRRICSPFGGSSFRGSRIDDRDRGQGAGSQAGHRFEGEGHVRTGLPLFEPQAPFTVAMIFLPPRT